MIQKVNHLSFVGIGLLAVVLAFSSCSEKDDAPDGYVPGEFGYKSLDEGDGGPSQPGGVPGDNSHAGVVTAGEWCDLTNWSFWSKLMLGEDFHDKSSYWEFYTNNRIAVKVSDESGNALAGVKVKLLSGRDDATVWEAVTDNHGEAECWVGLFQNTASTAVDQLRISLNGEVMDGHPMVCPWDSLQQAMPVNKYVCKNYKAPQYHTDIAFVVDATGSMSDEIDFLKQDLVDIISKVQSVRPDMKMRTAALFYRDEGDEYLTRHHNFTDDLKKTVGFVKEQSANGGNDYPEAVHTALERMLQDLSWNEDARTRLAFLLLDAPAHHDVAVIQSLQQSVETCAKQGIKLIPVAASGADKNTEFMLRFFAVATGGTYVFLTDDSGVGLSHIAASVGDYKVEQLNQLLIRLIEAYTE